MNIHALIDLSDLKATDARWASALALSEADSIAGLAHDVTCIVPAGVDTPNVAGTRWRWVSQPGVEAAHAALTRAGRQGAHLLVLSMPAAAAAEAAVALTEAFALDPLFGSVHPRFSTNDGASILSVFTPSDCDGQFARRTLLDLPAHYILPEYVSRCFVIRHELLANVDAPEKNIPSVGQLLLTYLRKARRVGFRSVVINRIVLQFDEVDNAHTEVRGAAADARHSDSAIARSRFARRVDLMRERRLASLHDSRPKILIDSRNLAATINGTSKTFFGLADALRDRRPEWAITLVASEHAAEYHDLDTRYPEWTVEHELPTRTFAAAFRPSQPWDLSELIGLHRLAAVNVFLMLDTIAWDVVYTATDRLDATWRFAAQYADALLFISEFSRQRFATRFPLHPNVRTEVCHLSLDPVDYFDPSARTRPTNGPYWFVVGNNYDHKHVQPTLALLARAFPTTRLAVLGSTSNGDRVTGLASGRSDEREVQALYAGAELVIFPSFYEGFGLPIVNALAYGRTVVARDSALLREIATAYAGPGRVVPFTTPDVLVERLSQLRHGQPVPELPLRAESAMPYGWAACAATIEAHINELIQPQRIRRERDRHETVLLLDSWTRADQSDTL